MDHSATTPLDELVERDGVLHLRGPMMWPHNEGEGKKERVVYTHTGYWVRAVSEEEAALYVKSEQLG